MNTIPVSIVQAFMHPDFAAGGNPAGVVLNADDLSMDQKQAIAAQVGLSETAFVSRSAVADFKLEFFTPKTQIPHCGHATIAAFSLLHQKGLLKKERSRKETIDGCRDIFIEGERIYMQQMGPRYTKLNTFGNLDTQAVMVALALRLEDLIPGHEPVVVNTGNAFLLVPVNSVAAMRRIRADERAITHISRLCGLIGFYLFTLQTRSADHKASARMFAPLYGITEESATGMAAGPLGCYLHDCLGFTEEILFLEQGFFMEPSSPGQLVVKLRLSGGKIEDLLVGGVGKVSGIKEIPLKH